MNHQTERRLLLLWLGSAAIVTVLRFLNVADLGYDLTLQIQAAQNLLAGKGLSAYWPADDDLAQPSKLAILTSWPCAYSLYAAALIAMGASLGTVVKVSGAAGTLLGWWGWGKLAWSFFGEGMSRGLLWRWTAYIIAILSPLLFTTQWQGTDIFLWAAIPWVLFWLVRAAEGKASGVSWYDCLAGAVCGLTVLTRYASVFLVVYALFLILCQSKFHLLTLTRRGGAFLGGLLPLLAIQAYVNYLGQTPPAALTFDRGVGAVVERLWVGLPWLTGANFSAAFWMPGRILKALTQTAEGAPWLLGVTVALFLLPWLLARKRGCGWPVAFRDIPVAAAGLLIVVPLFLWGCMMFGRPIYVADQRYYYPLLPLAVFVIYALALPKAGDETRLTKLVRTGSITYLAGYVLMAVAGGVLLLLPRGFDRRVKLMGTSHFRHWPSGKVHYEFSEARSYVVNRLREEPGSIVLTDREHWFYADASLDRSKVHWIVPCEWLRANYLMGPVHLLVLADSAAGGMEELYLLPLDAGWPTAAGEVSGTAASPPAQDIPGREVEGLGRARPSWHKDLSKGRYGTTVRKRTVQHSSRREAEIFGRYLLKREPSDYCISLYEQAMPKLSIPLHGRDEEILNFVLQNPWSIGLVDAGLCLFRKNAAVRRKIFTMLAILEASPECCDYFLPKKRSAFYFIFILWVGIRAAVKGILGGLLLKVI